MQQSGKRVARTVAHGKPGTLLTRSSLSLDQVSSGRLTPALN